VALLRGVSYRWLTSTVYGYVTACSRTAFRPICVSNIRAGATGQYKEGRRRTWRSSTDEKDPQDSGEMRVRAVRAREEDLVFGRALAEEDLHGLVRPGVLASKR